MVLRALHYSCTSEPAGWTPHGTFIKSHPPTKTRPLFLTPHASSINMTIPVHLKHRFSGWCLFAFQDLTTQQQSGLRWDLKNVVVLAEHQAAHSSPELILQPQPQPQPPPPPFWVSCTCNTPILPWSHNFLPILLYLIDWRPSLYSGEFVKKFTEKYLPHMYLWAISFPFKSNFKVHTSINCLDATVVREGHWTLFIPLSVISPKEQ